MFSNSCIFSEKTDLISRGELCSQYNICSNNVTRLLVFQPLKLTPFQIILRPCGYRNINYFLTVAVQLYRKLDVSVKILINLLLRKVTFESKRIKLSHQIWRQSGKISCLYSEGHGFKSQPGDRVPWLKCSGIFLSSLKYGQVTVQISLRQPPFITCVCHIP